MSLLLALATFALVIISLFMVLVILMQRAKSDGGVGAALGGGMAESAFGGETTNVLTKATQYAAILFFVLAFGLYLGRIYQHRSGAAGAEDALPAIEAPATAPANDALTLPSLDGVPSEAAPPAAAPETPAPDAGAEAAAPAAPAEVAPATVPETP